MKHWLDWVMVLFIAVVIVGSMVAAVLVFINQP